MTNAQDLILTPRLITGEEIVNAARGFIGLDYLLGAAIVWGEETDRDGAKSGACDCVGLWLLTARALDILAPGFDLSVPFSRYGVTREEVLMEMLRLNFRAVARGERAPGDLLFIRYPGVEEGRERHVAILGEQNGRETLIHALNRPAGTGRVCERLMDAHDAAITSRVWRLSMVERNAHAEKFNG